MRRLSYGAIVALLLVPRLAQLAEPLRAPPPALAAGTYVGLLPCADCEGLRYELEVRRDKTYALRTTYLGKGPLEPDQTVFDDIGRWLLSSDGEVLAIKGGSEAPEYFALQREKLLKLDLHGQPIESAGDYVLERSRKAAPLEPQLPLQGLLHVEAATFTECTTGAHWPVANEADWSAAERALAKAREDTQLRPGAPLMVSIEGTLRARSTLVIKRFNAVINDKTECESPFATLPLIGTAWTLIRLGSEVIEPHRGVRAVQLQFAAGQPSRVSGFSGCNRLLATAQVKRVAIAFGSLAATRVACPPGRAEQLESGVLQALANATRWRALGAILELYREGDTLLARFEGKPLAPVRQQR